MDRFGLFRALVCVAIISAKVHADWKAPVATEQLRQSKSALIPFPQQVNWRDEDWIVPPNVVEFRTS